MPIFLYIQELISIPSISLKITAQSRLPISLFKLYPGNILHLSDYFPKAARIT